MNTALTQAIIQLGRNKRCAGGADVWERRSQHSQTHCPSEITQAKEYRHTVPHVYVTHELIHNRLFRLFSFLGILKEVHLLLFFFLDQE